MTQIFSFYTITSRRFSEMEIIFKPSEKLMEVTKMAVETCVWPLYEVVEGKYILSYKPKNKLPVEEYLKMQGRFAHMFKPGNEWMIEEVQKEVDKNWEELLKLCEL